jgi:hypothetical protein
VFDSASCDEVYDDTEADLILSGYKLSTEFASQDLALAACPQKEDICGSTVT